MSLRRVDLSTDVYFVCLNHSMCTEGEEIVGLLVGEVDEERVAHVVAVVILRRSDKRKDRVEISPEQLSNASTEAEKLACILKRPVRVIGWYHSHPKLTVYPSLVDVCTQESYQLMDEGFIGMIFSVFNPDPNKFGGRIQMICYQSHSVVIDCNVEKSHVEIPIQLVPSSYISDVCMNSIVQLPRFLCQEEQLAYQMANQVPLDYLTRLHNSSVYLRKMGQIAEVICGPLLKMLEERILNNEMKRKRLQERKKALTAQIEKVKRENAQKEKEIQEKARRKEQEKAEQALKKEQKMIEHVGLKTQNLVKSQVVEQVLVAPLQLNEEELVIPTVIEEQEEILLEDQSMQEQIQSKEKDLGKQGLKDLNIQSEFHSEQKMQIGPSLEEQIMLEDYHIPDHDIQEFQQLQEEMLQTKQQQSKPNKFCIEDQKLQDALPSKMEDKLSNDEFKAEKLQASVSVESGQKNLQEGFQVLKKKVQNIENSEDKEKIQLKKQDPPVKFSHKKSEISAISSVCDDSKPSNDPVPKNVQRTCASEFIRSVESLSVTDGNKKSENKSDISKCNIEDVPNVACYIQKFDANSGQKSNEKNTSLPAKISLVGSGDSNVQPSFHSVSQDTSVMEASSLKTTEKETTQDQKH